MANGKGDKNRLRGEELRKYEHNLEIIKARKEAYANGCNSLQVELRHKLAIVELALELAVSAGRGPTDMDKVLIEKYTERARKQLDPEYKGYTTEPHLC